ncbi:MAG TPA: BON domain-containing protein [Polyangia bacterium]|nr:BON domain-containing protein [Polyangia bacterium]
MLLIVLALTSVACPMSTTLPAAKPLDPRAPPPTDEQLTAAVRERLDQIWVLERRFIGIHTRNRIVHLDGWVETVYERQLIEEVARTTPGVAGVTSDLRITRV